MSSFLSIYLLYFEVRFISISVFKKERERERARVGRRQTMTGLGTWQRPRSAKSTQVHEEPFHINQMQNTVYKYNSIITKPGPNLCLVKAPARVVLCTDLMKIKRINIFMISLLFYC